MYVPVTTEDFDKWIKAESRTFETRCDVIIGNTTYRLSGSGLGGDIISMQWNNVVCSNDGLQIGTSCMDEFRMEYRNNNSIPSLMNSEIHPYVGLVIPHENTGDVTVWIPLGVFYVTNTETNDDGRTYTITAYDKMQFLMDNFDASTVGVTFPINAWDLLTAICTAKGITLSYDPAIEQLLTSEEYVLYGQSDRLLVTSEIDANRRTSLSQPLEGTYREYVGWIAGLIGASAHFDRDGNLRLFQYADTGYTIGRDVQHMGGAKINYGGAVTYTSIVSGTDGNEVYPTSYSGNAITYTNPFITVTELDRVCDALIGTSGITVTPCDVEWRSNPCVDAGDLVYVVDKDMNLLPIYVMDRTVNVTGGLSEVTHCYGETEIAHTLNQSPMVKKINVAVSTAKVTADMINNTKGTMRMLLNEDGSNYGYEIVENDGVSWLRCTAGGLGLSNNGGLTYTNAITKDGVTASQLHVIRSGVEVMSAGEGSNGFPELMLRDNEGDRLFRVALYEMGDGAVEDADIGAYLRLYNSDGNSLAYIGTIGNTTTGKVTGVSMQMYDPVVSTSTSTFAVFSQRSTNDTGGGTYLHLTDPATNRHAVSLQTSYFDDPNNAPASGYIYLWDTVHNRMKVRIGSYGSASQRVGCLSFFNYESDTSNREMFSIYATGSATPYIAVYDSANSVVRNLSLRSITINGTNYYMFAST